VFTITEIRTFDLSTNVRLIVRSVELARAYGVPQATLIKSEAELDTYMLI
jgi:hypothetical protein